MYKLDKWHQWTVESYCKITWAFVVTFAMYGENVWMGKSSVWHYSFVPFFFMLYLISSLQNNLWSATFELRNSIYGICVVSNFCFKLYLYLFTQSLSKRMKKVIHFWYIDLHHKKEIGALFFSWVYQVFKVENREYTER